MTLADLAIISGTSFLACFLAEIIAWLFIFRTEDYQRLKDSVDRLTAKVDKKKDAGPSSKKDKKTERYGDQLKRVNSELMWVRVKSMVFVGVTMSALFGILSSAFEGKIVAYLPFEPLAMIQSVSHRNLLGNDPRDCGWLFIYILSSIVFRPVIQKMLGTTPQSNPNPFASMFDQPTK